MSDNNPLEIEVPQWGSVFKDTRIHPDNLMLESSEHKLRRLTSHERKKFRDDKKKIHRLLKKHGYYRLLDEHDRLKVLFQNLKIAIHNGDDVIAEFKKVQARGKWIRAKIEKFKPLTERLRYIAMREDEHRNAREYERRERRDTKQMRREVKHFATRIIERYSQLGHKDEVIEKNGKTRRYKVRFSDVYVTPDEIIFKIDVSRVTVLGSNKNQLPEGVKVRDLVHPDTLDELASACERSVYSPHNSPEHMGVNKDFSSGAYIIVARLDMAGGLPNYIELKHLLAKYRQDDRHKFPLPVGVMRGRKIEWSYMTKSPHYMINGLTGSGKSNVIRAWVCTLIQMHRPDEIRIILTDLKRGGDFKPFQHIPHLLGDGIIKSPSALANMLERVVHVLYQRQERIGEIATNIDEYNSLVDEDLKLARLMVVIDEYSETQDFSDATIKKRIDVCVSIIARLGRAAGIQLVIGNQQPYADSIPASVKGNITSHLTGYQMTLGASFSTVGDASAKKIERIAGRMIFNNGLGINHVQTPLATKGDIASAVKASDQWQAPREFDWYETTPPAVIEGDTEPVKVIPKPKQNNREDFVALVLAEFDGVLSSRRIHEAHPLFASRPQMELWVKEIALLGELEHDGMYYRVKRVKGGGFQISKFPTDENSPLSPENEAFSGNLESEGV